MEIGRVERGIKCPKELSVVASGSRSYYLDDMQDVRGALVVCKANILPDHQDITVGKTYRVIELNYGTQIVLGILDDNGKARVPSARFQYA